MSLPAPPISADVDLRDFAFMPLDVARLRDSDLASEATPEECWAAVLLWCASWHQLPAGSIPNSDQWMAKQAGYVARGRIDPQWSKVKEGALRGFVECSDGRLYHGVVCEKAMDAWKSKLAQRWRTECNRIKKYNQRHGTELATPDFEEWLSLGCPQGQMLNVPRDTDSQSPGQGGYVPGDKGGLSPGCPSENGSKGQGEGQGQGQGQGQGDSKKIDTPDGVSVPGDAGDLDLLGTSMAPKPIPECPHEKIIAAYHAELPMLRQVVVWNDERKTLLRTRWREDVARQTVEWWSGLFRYIAANCPMLIGNHDSRDHAGWQADLEWIIRPRNFVKVIEGKYERGVAANG